MTGGKPEGSPAYCCEICAAADPHWMITRKGDVVTSWACDLHLATVCERLQRDFEVSELVLIHFRKAREWSDIDRTLRGIAKEAQP